MSRRKDDSLHTVAPNSQDERFFLPSLPERDALPIEDDLLAELLLDEDTGALEPDPWGEDEDPFDERHVPNSLEAEPIEAEDMRRAMAQSETLVLSQTPVPARTVLPRSSRSWLFARRHWPFMLLALGLSLLLVFSGVLFVLQLTRQQRPAPNHRVTSAPMLTITPTSAHPGQVIRVHLANFAPSARVFLTRDMQQTLRTDSGTSLITVGQDGSADVHVLVQDTWGPGSHLLVAEDIKTHYTASVSLPIQDSFPLPAPRLVVSSVDQPAALKGTLFMGMVPQGGNTVQSVLLRNTGGSWIAWKAVSNVPWLMTAPTQGIFQENQALFVAVSRAHLAPGNYQGAITITSNAGDPITLHIAMSVLPTPALQAASIVVEPPVLSFVATDGMATPPAQELRLSNPGKLPLNWALSASALTNLVDQGVYAQDAPHWLTANMAGGIVAPGAATNIAVRVQSQQLLPGVYSGLLTFTAGEGVLNVPQTVAVALTVLPRCGITSGTAIPTFTLTQSQSRQTLDLQTTPGCAEATNWQAFPLTDWLNVTPVSGQLAPGTATPVSLQVNTRSLSPGTYSGLIEFLTEMRSMTLAVEVVILPPGKTGRGVSGAPGTPVTGSTVTPQPGTPIASPTTAPGTPTPVPGTPTPTPAPCSFQVSPASLTFIATLLQPNPPGQALALSVTGHCAQPVTWNASVSGNSQQWLSLSASSGTIGSSGSNVVVFVHTTGMVLGNYSGTITLSIQGGGSVRGSPRSIPVTLAVIL